LEVVQAAYNRGQDAGSRATNQRCGSTGPIQISAYESGLLISPESERPRQNLGSAYHVRGTTRYNLHSFCDARVLTGKNNRTMSIFERAVEADDFSLLASMTGRKMSRFTPIYSCAVALIQYTRV